MTTAKNNNRKMAYRIIILGGYGNFGARVARALASEPNIELIVAGRDLGSASRFVRTIGGAGAACEATGLDHTAYDFPANLHALRPNLVVHTSGRIARSIPLTRINNWSPRWLTSKSHLLPLSLQNDGSIRLVARRGPLECSGYSK